MLFWIDSARYRYGIDPRTNTEYIERSQCYDSTRYHWARVDWKSGKWIAYFNGRSVLSFDAGTKEDAARTLVSLDEKAHLTPCVDRT